MTINSAIEIVDSKILIIMAKLVLTINLFVSLIMTFLKKESIFC